MYKVIGCADIQDADKQRPYYGTGLGGKARFSRTIGNSCTVSVAITR